METIACNFHDETGEVVKTFRLQGGDDAEHATWMELSSSLKLFASHVDFLKKVAILHKAHW
jgi:ADP-ribose pyrophosphatase